MINYKRTGKVLEEIYLLVSRFRDEGRIKEKDADELLECIMQRSAYTVANPLAVHQLITAATLATKHQGRVIEEEKLYDTLTEDEALESFNELVEEGDKLEIIESNDFPTEDELFEVINELAEDGKIGEGDKYNIMFETLNIDTDFDDHTSWKSIVDEMFERDRKINREKMAEKVNIRGVFLKGSHLEGPPAGNMHIHILLDEDDVNLDIIDDITIIAYKIFESYKDKKIYGEDISTDIFTDAMVIKVKWSLDDTDEAPMIARDISAEIRKKVEQYFERKEGKENEKNNSNNKQQRYRSIRRS